MGCDMGSKCPSIYREAPIGDHWPNKTERNIIKAALLPGVEAIKHWNRWRSKVPFEHIDSGSQRLLPLLYKNLTALGVDEPIITKYKGVYRMTWVDNQITLQKLAPVLKSFQSADISTIILKGGAMIGGYYQNPGLRRIGEIELLIPTRRAPDAVRKLNALGWQPDNGGHIDSINDRYCSLKTAQRFNSQEGGNIKIQWHLSLEKGNGTIDADYWRRARQIEITGENTYIYCPAEQLMEACVWAAWVGSEPQIQSIADATMIMQKSGSEVEWDRLLRLTKKRRLVLPIFETLANLVDLLDAPIPSEVIQELNGIEVSKTELWEHKVRKGSLGLVSSLLKAWFGYSRLSRDELDAPLQPSFSGFPNFLGEIWELDHIWQVPIEAGRKGIRRFRRRLEKR